MTTAEKLRHMATEMRREADRLDDAAKFVDENKLMEHQIIELMRIGWKLLDNDPGPWLA